MTDAFAGLVGPIFRHVIDFQDRLARGEDPPLEAERSRALALLADAEQHAGNDRQLAAGFELAKHALVYWVDEIMITSRWSRAPAWKERVLEYEVFGEWVGGERFYEKCDEAAREHNTDALETFFLCVALGFRGVMVLEESKLRRWAEKHYGRILAGSRHPDRFLPDEPRDAEAGALKPLPGKSILLTVSILVSASALVTLACFLAAFGMPR